MQLAGTRMWRGDDELGQKHLKNNHYEIRMLLIYKGILQVLDLCYQVFLRESGETNFNEAMAFLPWIRPLDNPLYLHHFYGFFSRG